MQEVNLVSNNIVVIIVCVHLPPGNEGACVNKNNRFYKFCLELWIYFYKYLVSLQIILFYKNLEPYSITFN